MRGPFTDIIWGSFLYSILAELGSATEYHSEHCRYIIDPYMANRLENCKSSVNTLFDYEKRQ